MQQLQTLAKPGDNIVCISASGNSKNIIKAGKDRLSDQIIFGSDSINYILKENNILKNQDINKSVDISWFNINLAKKKISRKYLKIHQGDGVQMLRIITELHNGRFFGSIYTLILFISSLSLIFLTLSSFIFATNIFKNKK